MSLALVTGSGGLVGSQTTKLLIEKGLDVLGVDNNMRKHFFGDQGSVSWNIENLKQLNNYTHFDIDIRDSSALEKIYKNNKESIKVIVHCAAQPSHDWAVKDPVLDYEINALSTLHLLELYRKYCPEAAFIFTSTNKVYGDRPNKLPLIELPTRYEIPHNHDLFIGIPETFSIDQSTHSIFGASKASADILVQEYGRYFGLNTGVFRGGCLTGPYHSGAELHGFLSYLGACVYGDEPYTVFGHKGKQVRDNIHVKDLVYMFWFFMNDPKPGEVYNAGGGRFSNCSVLEAIKIFEGLTGKSLNYNLSSESRIGDHQWYISDCSKFKSHYPIWEHKYNLEKICKDIINEMRERKN